MPLLSLCNHCFCQTKTICGKCRAEKNLDGHLAMLNSLTGMALEQQKTQLLAEVIEIIEKTTLKKFPLGKRKWCLECGDRIRVALTKEIKKLSVTAVRLPEKTGGTETDLLLIAKGIKDWGICLENMNELKEKILKILDTAEVEKWFDMESTHDNWKTWKRIRNQIGDL